MVKRIEIPVVHPDIARGLTESQVQERLDAGWCSGPARDSGKSVKKIILSNTLTFFNLIFLLLAGLLVFSGSSILNMGFLIAAAVNSAIGIVQELRAKQAVDQLTLLVEKPVLCLRDGTLQEIPPDKVVRDDLVQFSQGQQLCGDGVLRSGCLWVNESQITGEEDSVEKQPGDSLHSGSIVLAGTGIAELTAVGEDSEAAKLAAEARKNPMAAKSEMLRSLDRLILVLGLLLVPIGVLLFRQEYLILGLSLRESAEGTVSALTGMIPEGLYVLTSVALAVSSLKLGRSKVLVRDRNSIEALARVDVLCVDKTGTITEPTMEVEDVVPLSDLPAQELQNMLTAMYAGSEETNATSQAIRALFQGTSPLAVESRIPFSPETKWSGCTFRDGPGLVVGAPEFIMGDCLGPYAEQVESWAGQGFRVVMAAKYDGIPVPGSLDSHLATPLALLLLTNRLRPQAKETFAYFREQGVQIKVISGDNPATVSKIAQEAGIEGAENYLDVTPLETDKEFREAVRNNTVFGRVTPQKKKQLIAALQKEKHTVAMTGDGVNDLLAMKQADCSVAMGCGAQAASQMASLVLLDSDFSAMPQVVAEGRRVINNIQRTATLFLVKNIFSLFLSLITLFTTWPYPMQPIHISVISTVTIGLPAFLLTLEPSYDRISGHFLRGVLRRAFPGGLTNVFVVLVCQAFMTVFGISLAEGSTVCTAILCFVGILVLFQVCRPFRLFRALVWVGMVALVALVFLSLGDLFYLDLHSQSTLLVMLTLLLMTPSIFLFFVRVFDFAEGCIRWIVDIILGFFHFLKEKNPLRKRKHENL